MYIVVVMCALLGGLPLYLRTQGIFACPATGYTAHDFIADCNASAYGDYDHGAFWFGLEPEALRSAAEADVLFLGSSRLQFGLSSKVAADWFARRSIHHFLFGFSDTETVVFAGPVLRRLEPRAKAIVINVDRFFDDRISKPTQELLRNNSEAWWKYRAKRAWQSFHRDLCGKAPLLCGSSTVVYRSRTNGAWQMHGARVNEGLPVFDGPPLQSERWPEFSRIAEGFLSHLPVQRNCVLLTIVPTVETKRAEAEAIASAVGLELVAPQVGGLRTFDGSHLDAVSAERWSSAFLDAAAPRLLNCLGR